MVFDSSEIEKAIKRDLLIEETEVECHPEKLSHSVLDENVDIYLVRKFFTSDAWMVVENIVDRKREDNLWLCPVCQHDLHANNSGDSILCNSYLQWYHFSCMGITSRPKQRDWFCRICYSCFS